MGFAVWSAKKCPKDSSSSSFSFSSFSSSSSSPSFPFFILLSGIVLEKFVLIDVTNKGAEPENSNSSFFILHLSSVSKEIQHKHRIISICSSDDNG